MLDTGWIIGILVIRLNIICIWLGSMIPKISQNICKHHQGFGHCWSQSATARGTSKSHLANCSQGPASPTFNSWSQWLLLHESLHWHTDRGTTSVPYPDQAGFNVKNGNRNFGIQLILWMLEKSANCEEDLARLYICKEVKSWPCFWKSWQIIPCSFSFTSIPACSSTTSGCCVTSPNPSRWNGTQNGNKSKHFELWMHLCRIEFILYLLQTPHEWGGRESWLPVQVSVVYKARRVERCPAKHFATSQHIATTSRFPIGNRKRSSMASESSSGDGSKDKVKLRRRTSQPENNAGFRCFTYLTKPNNAGIFLWTLEWRNIPPHRLL